MIFELLDQAEFIAFHIASELSHLKSPSHWNKYIDWPVLSIYQYYMRLSRIKSHVIYPFFSNRMGGIMLNTACLLINITGGRQINRHWENSVWLKVLFHVVLGEWRFFGIYFKPLLFFRCNIDKCFCRGSNNLYHCLLAYY